MPQLSHISIGVKSYTISKTFYDAVLSTISSTRIYTNDATRTLGYASNDKPDNETFTLFETDGPVPSGPGVHYAFTAPDRRSVQRFWETAMQMGGRDAGKWGPRPHYGHHYYAAFVLDPDGYKLEVVCQTPELVPDECHDALLQQLVASWNTKVDRQRRDKIKAWEAMDTAQLTAELQSIETN